MTPRDELAERVKRFFSNEGFRNGTSANCGQALLAEFEQVRLATLEEAAKIVEDWPVPSGTGASYKEIAKRIRAAGESKEDS